jgi:hypothetical protein
MVRGQDGISASPPIVLHQDTREQDTREGCPYISCTGIVLFIVKLLFFIENTAHMPLILSGIFGPALEGW